MGLEDKVKQFWDCILGLPRKLARATAIGLLGAVLTSGCASQYIGSFTVTEPSGKVWTEETKVGKRKAIEYEIKRIEISGRGYKLKVVKKEKTLLKLKVERVREYLDRTFDVYYNPTLPAIGRGFLWTILGGGASYLFYVVEPPSGIVMALCMGVCGIGFVKKAANISEGKKAEFVSLMKKLYEKHGALQRSYLSAELSDEVKRIKREFLFEKTETGDVKEHLPSNVLVLAFPKRFFKRSYGYLKNGVVLFSLNNKNLYKNEAFSKAELIQKIKDYARLYITNEFISKFISSAKKLIKKRNQKIEFRTADYRKDIKVENGQAYIYLPMYCVDFDDAAKRLVERYINSNIKNVVISIEQGKDSRVVLQYSGPSRTELVRKLFKHKLAEKQVKFVKDYDLDEKLIDRYGKATFRFYFPSEFEIKIINPKFVVDSGPILVYFDNNEIKVKYPTLEKFLTKLKSLGVAKPRYENDMLELLRDRIVGWRVKFNIRDCEVPPSWFFCLTKEGLEKAIKQFVEEKINSYIGSVCILVEDEKGQPCKGTKVIPVYRGYSREELIIKHFTKGYVTIGLKFLDRYDLETKITSNKGIVDFKYYLPSSELDIKVVPKEETLIESKPIKFRLSGVDYERMDDIEKRLEKLDVLKNFTEIGRRFAMQKFKDQLRFLNVYWKCGDTMHAKFYYLPKNALDVLVEEFASKINSNIKEIKIRVIDEKTKKPVYGAIVDVKYFGPSREALLKRYFRIVDNRILQKIRPYDLKPKETNKNGEVTFRVYVPCKLMVDVIDWDYWFKRAKVEFEPGKLKRTIDVTRIPK